MKSLFLCLILVVSVNSHRYNGPTRIHLGTRILPATYLGSSGSYYQGPGLSGLYGRSSLYGYRGFPPSMRSSYYRSGPSFSYGSYPGRFSYGELGLNSGFDNSDDGPSFGPGSSRFGYNFAGGPTLGMGMNGRSSFGYSFPYSNGAFPGSSSLRMGLSGSNMNLGDLSNGGFGDTSIGASFGTFGRGYSLGYGDDDLAYQGLGRGMSSLGGLGYRSSYGPSSYYSRSSFGPIGSYSYGQGPSYVSSRSMYGPVFSSGVYSSSVGSKKAVYQ